jgi:hypothetical protein
MIGKENNFFEISSSYVTFSSAMNESNLSQERIDELSPVNILALPTKGYHGKEGYFFFGGAREFYMYCQENAPNQSIDFCIEKSEYSEIDLNSIELFLGTFIISSIIIPVFVNLISDYINNQLKHDDDKITLNIIINNHIINNSIEINFRGTKGDFDNKVLKTLSTYDKDGQIQLTNKSGSKIDVLS